MTLDLIPAFLAVIIAAFAAPHVVEWLRSPQTGTRR